MKNKYVLNFLVFIFVSMEAVSQTKIHGKITGNNALPLANVSVHVLNTNYGAISDASGNFIIGQIVRGDYVIQFSSIGYAEKNKKIVVDKTEINLDIKLEEAGSSLDEVVVTAQKKEELLQQLPLSITSISAKEVRDFRLWNSKDITAIVPNLYAADPGDKRNVTSVRGVTTTSYDPAVATYIDGVNQFSLDTYISPLFDIERIEVLRGPQGTLYGRNASGGVINIITKQPTNNFNGFAEITLGNYGTHRFSGGIKGPVIKDKLFFGVAELYDEMDGFYTNEFNKIKYDRQHSFVGNYFLKYIPGSKWALTLNAKHNNNRNNGAFPLVTDVDEAFQNSYKLNQNAITKLVDNIFNTSLSADYSGSKFNLQSQTSYQSNYRYYTKPIDADFSAIDGITLINNYGKDWNNVKVFTQELKFSNAAGTSSSLNWTVGTYFFTQQNPTKVTTHFGQQGTDAGGPDNNVSLINTTKAKGHGIAFYGQATYLVTKKLNLTAGLRYDDEYKRQAILGEYQSGSDSAFPIRTDTSASASFDAVTPKLSLSYNLNDDHLLFVSYSKGYRAGGLTPLSSDPTLPALFPFKPEYSNNVEAGLKNTFSSKRLAINISAFFTEINNAQVPTLVLPDAVTITRNTGRLNSKGVEVEMAAALIKGLEINYNAGYTHAVYKSLKLSQNNSELDLKNKRQVFTPAYTSMLVIQYSYSFTKNKDIKILLRGELKSVGSQYFNLANTIQQKSYSLINTSLGIGNKSCQLLFWGRNITAKKYIAYAYDFGAVHLGDPNTYGITFRIEKI